MYTNRISTAARYNLIAADIQKNEALFNKLTAQLASGKKITNITDDPIAAVNIVNTNRQLGQIETFNQNVEMGMSELNTLDDLMELAGGYLSHAWDKAVQANNGTYGAESLKALKVEIDEITKTMVDLANTEYNDNYIFGGTNTKMVPYTIDEDGSVTYHGTPSDNPEYIRSTEVADGVFETINVTGDRVFGYYRAANDDANMFTDGNNRQVIKGDDNIYRYENGNVYRSGRSEHGLTQLKDDQNNNVVGAYTDADGKLVFQVAVEEDDGSGNITTSYLYKYEDWSLYGTDGKSAAGLTPVKDSEGNPVISVFKDGNGKNVFGYDVVEEDEDGNPVHHNEYKYANGDLYGDGTDNTGLTAGVEEDAQGVMGALKKLSISIQEVIDGIEAEDDTAIQAGYADMNLTLDMFKDALDTITTEQTKFGGVYNRLEMTESTLETNNQNLTSYLSQLQDVDLADAISKWYQAQYAYQASLQVAASSMGMSLLNYI